jgi:hypothetical protein
MKGRLNRITAMRFCNAPCRLAAGFTPGEIDGERDSQWIAELIKVYPDEEADA